MVRNAQGARASLGQLRGAVVESLRGRRGDIEQAALARTFAVSDSREAADPEYLGGLRAAVSAALDYGLAALERGEEDSPPVPAALLAQARLAARSGVELDTVLRRYFAGYTLLGDFMTRTAEDEGLRGASLQQVVREQAAMFDRLVAAVTAEFSAAKQGLHRTSEERRAERLQGLLEGELLDASEFEYDFDGHHLGAIAAGADGSAAIRALAVKLDRRLLVVRPTEDVVWAWMGGRREIAWSDLEAVAASMAEQWAPLALGEPATGLAGWRLTHRQAKAALPIAMRRGGIVRYSGVAILASLLQDDLLATSLRDSYLTPLEKERDGGKTARKTLRAYFATDRNVSSAAAALGVSRRTVANRLRAIEERLDRRLGDIGVEMDLALRLDALEAGTGR